LNQTLDTESKKVLHLFLDCINLEKIRSDFASFTKQILYSKDKADTTTLTRTIRKVFAILRRQTTMLTETEIIGEQNPYRTPEIKFTRNKNLKTPKLWISKPNFDYFPLKIIFFKNKSFFSCIPYFLNYICIFRRHIIKF